MFLFSLHMCVSLMHSCVVSPTSLSRKTLNHYDINSSVVLFFEFYREET